MYYHDNPRRMSKMAKWSEGLHHLHAKDARNFILGESSKVEEVFLSTVHPTEGGGDTLHRERHNSCNGSLPQHSPTAPLLTDAEEDGNLLVSKGPNCYQVFMSSILVISVTCVLLLLCRDYIKDVLIWLEQVNRVISFLIFLLLFILVSFPLAWGVILLMIAAGYLYGFVYGPIVVSLSGAIGVLVAHVAMKHCCRSFIMKKFYNDKMTAVISVVEGKHGFKVVFLTRLTPLPFGLQNSLFSLTDISTVTYVVASTLGLIPTAVLNAYMGSTFRSMEDLLTDETSQTTGYLVLVVQALLTFALMFFVVRKARAELKKTVETDEEIGKSSPEVVVHNDAKFTHDISKTNGFSLDRSRHLSS